MSLAQQLREGLAAMGLILSAEVQARLDRLEKLTTDRKAVVFEIEGKDAHRQLGIINRESLPYLAKRALHPPVLTDRDVKPGRMIEYGVLWQICTYGAWGLLCIAAGLAFLDRFRTPRVIVTTPPSQPAGSPARAQSPPPTHSRGRSPCAARKAAHPRHW